MLSSRRFSFGTGLAISTLIATLLIPVLPATATTCDPTGNIPANISKGTESFGGGTGSNANSPWQICSIAQMRAIETNTETMSAFYALKADLDFSSNGAWDPIGAAAARTFTGSFNGNFFTLRNLTIDSNRPRLGLFYSTSTGTISRLKFQDVTLIGSSSITTSNSNNEPTGGVLAGTSSSTISEIVIDGVNVSGNLFTAGFLLGSTLSFRPNIELIKITRGNLTSSWAANSSTKNYMGGLIGLGRADLFRVSIAGRIYRTASAYVEAAIGGVFGGAGSLTPRSIAEQVHVDATLDGANGDISAIGGINGENVIEIKDVLFTGTIVNPSANLSTARAEYVGGLSGLNRHDTDTPIASSLVTSAVPYALGELGPIVGDLLAADAGKVVSPTIPSFYDSDLNPTYAQNSGSYFGSPKTTLELKSIATYHAATWSIARTDSDQVLNWSLSGSTSVDRSGATPVWTNPVWQINEGQAYPTLVWTSVWPASLTAPTGVSATVSGDGVASLNWTAPSGTIAGYRIESSSNGGVTWQTELLDSRSNATTATVSGLVVGQSYQFRVSAYSASAFSSGYSTPSVDLLMQTEPPSYNGPLIESFSNRELRRGAATQVTLDGRNLSQVTDLFIGATKLAFTRTASNQLVVTLPALDRGVYDLRILYGGGAVLTHQSAFTVMSNSVGVRARTITISNFAGDQSRLPAAAQRSIRFAAGSLGPESVVVCTGSTSAARASSADRRLALSRAQAACDLVKRFAPGVSTEVRANPASGLGARFRSVTIEVSGN